MNVNKAVKSLLRRVIITNIGEIGLAQLKLWTGRIDQNYYYDILSELIMQRTLCADSVCVDVGCHTGQILKVMMTHARSGNFLAFEPLPDFYGQLCRDFSNPPVKLFNVALSNSEGQTTFKWVKSNPSYSGLRERRYDRPDEVIETISVSTQTLDRIVGTEKLNRLDLIKIDVEGAEYLVLEGAIETIQKFKPTVIFEHGRGGSDSYGYTPQHVFDLLAKCDLKVWTLNGFLRRRPPLTVTEFARQFNVIGNYYWVAHV